MGNRDGGWKVRRREREQRWVKYVAAWRQSGMSQAEYCRRHGLAPADFSWWKHQLIRREKKKVRHEAPVFVPVQVTNSAGEAAYEVVLRNGRCLRMGRGIEPEQAAKMVCALEAAGPC